jgi:hypothetical protein
MITNLEACGNLGVRKLLAALIRASCDFCTPTNRSQPWSIETTKSTLMLCIAPSFVALEICFIFAVGYFRKVHQLHESRSIHCDEGHTVGSAG